MGAFHLSKIFGYHGTPVRNLPLIANSGFKAGTRNGLWLGSGVYFFMDAPGRSANYAKNWGAKNGEDIAVLRSEIDLTHSMDLIDQEYWNFLSELYALYASEIEQRVQQDRRLKGRPDQVGPIEYAEMLRSGQIDPLTGYNVRDCLLMNLAWKELVDRGTRIDVVRAAFVEGRPVHMSSWLWDESNVMVCVKDTAAISNTVRIY